MSTKQSVDEATFDKLIAAGLTHYFTAGLTIFLPIYLKLTSAVKPSQRCASLILDCDWAAKVICLVCNITNSMP